MESKLAVVALIDKVRATIEYKEEFRSYCFGAIDTYVQKHVKFFTF